MQITETLSDGLKRAYSIVVPAAEIEGRRLARLTDVGKTARIPGFRPGKIPMMVIRKRYGEAVASEVLQAMVNDAAQKVVEGNGLRPATQPEPALTNPESVVASPATDLEFTIQFEILPNITLPDFAALSLTRLKAVAPPEAIDNALAMMSKRSRALEDLTDEDRAARGDSQGAIDGDVLTIDFLGKIDDVAFEGGTASDIDVEIGGSGFIPGFAEQLVGATVGDSRTITVTFPANYGTESLAGKEATFDVTVKQLRKPIETPIDDSFAQKMGLETLDELRTAMTEQMQGNYDQQSRQRLKRQLLDKLADLTDFPSPDSMVTREFDQIWQRLVSERDAGRLDEEDKNKDDDTLRAEYRAIAERRVRLGLLLAEIGRINGLTVTPDEMNRAMRAEMRAYPGREAQMMEFFLKYPQMTDSLRGPILEEKVVDFVLELAQVTEEIVTPEALGRDPSEATPMIAPVADAETAAQATE